MDSGTLLDSSRDEIRGSGAAATGRPRHCEWCGSQLPEAGVAGRRQASVAGRRRRYCGQACRQRAYERRTAVQRGGLPDDAVVLSGTEVANLQDRLFQLRCAAEDVMTALDDGASTAELRTLVEQVADAATQAERLRA